MRFSIYSTSPSFSSNLTTATENSGMQEIKDLTSGLERLENKNLAQQRFVPSESKRDVMSKISLGAKVERALSRRMANQDYVRKEKPSTQPIRKHKDVLEVLSEKRDAQLTA